MEVLQVGLTPVAILIGTIVNYRLLSQGLKQMREANESRTKREEESTRRADQRHEQAMVALAQQMIALSELIERTGLTSRPA